MEARKMLEESQHELKEAIDELRSLAHGIYPPLLMEEGLAKALSVAASRAPLTTTVLAASLPRYPEEVETAVYFCCMEALQNAYKHAGDTAGVTIELHDDGGALVFEIRDDGTGFDPGDKVRGAGFVNMRDRLGTLGGTLRLESAPGRGTEVTGIVPVPSVPDGRSPSQRPRRRRRRRGRWPLEPPSAPNRGRDDQRGGGRQERPRWVRGQQRMGSRWLI